MDCLLLTPVYIWCIPVYIYLLPYMAFRQWRRERQEQSTLDTEDDGPAALALASVTDADAEAVALTSVSEGGAPPNEGDIEAGALTEAEAEAEAEAAGLPDDEAEEETWIDIFLVPLIARHSLWRRYQEYQDSLMHEYRETADTIDESGVPANAGGSEIAATASVAVDDSVGPFNQASPLESGNYCLRTHLIPPLR